MLECACQAEGHKCGPFTPEHVLSHPAEGRQAGGSEHKQVGGREGSRPAFIPRRCETNNAQISKRPRAPRDPNRKR